MEISLYFLWPHLPAHPPAEFTVALFVTRCVARCLTRTHRSISDGFSLKNNPIWHFLNCPEDQEAEEKVLPEAAQRVWVLCAACVQADRRAGCGLCAHSIGGRGEAAGMGGCSSLPHLHFERQLKHKTFKYSSLVCNPKRNTLTKGKLLAHYVCNFWFTAKCGKTLKFLRQTIYEYKHKCN